MCDILYNYVSLGLILKKKLEEKENQDLFNFKIKEGSFVLGNQNILYKIHGFGVLFIINNNIYLDIDFYKDKVILDEYKIQEYINSLGFYDLNIKDILEKAKKGGIVEKNKNNEYFLKYYYC